MRYFIFVILSAILFSCSYNSSPWSPQLYNTITFSKDFTEEEKAYILEGFNVWRRETNCDVKFEEVENGRILINKATEEDIKSFDEKIRDTVLGLATLGENPEILFVFQRINSFEELELIAAHEAGHHLGMEHISQDQTAIMNPNANKLLINNTHLTRYDLDQFNNYWRCD